MPFLSFHIHRATLSTINSPLSASFLLTANTSGEVEQDNGHGEAKEREGEEAEGENRVTLQTKGRSEVK